MSAYAPPPQHNGLAKPGECISRAVFGPLAPPSRAVVSTTMYAIIEEGGGQRRVHEGDVLEIDLVEGGGAQPGKKITFDKVLVIGTANAKTAVKIGAPYVAGASVTAEVLHSLTKGDKIHIHKFRTREGYRRKTGHRQKYTMVKITAIKA